MPEYRGPSGALYSGFVPQQRGPVTPEKYEAYGTPGPNYYEFGEQPGYVYDPRGDFYRPDPRVTEQYETDFGFAEKDPTLFEQITPLAMATGTLGAVQGLVTNPRGVAEGARDVYQGVGGLFGFGGEVPAAPQVVGAGNVGPTTLSGGAVAYPAGSFAGTAPAAPEMVGAGYAAGAPAEAGGAGLLSGFSSLPAGPMAGIAAGVLLGARGAYDTVTGDDTEGPLEWSARATIGIATGGISEIVRATGLFDSKDRWRTERNRLSELQDDGVFVPENLMESMPTGPRSRDELTRKDLPDDYIGRDSAGNWVNNKFANSRDEKDLRAEDIVNYSTFAERDPDWFRKPLEERLQFANSALLSGAVEEHHGTIDIDYDKIREQPQRQQPAPQPQPKRPQPMAQASQGGPQIPEDARALQLAKGQRQPRIAYRL